MMEYASEDLCKWKFKKLLEGPVPKSGLSQMSKKGFLFIFLAISQCIYAQMPPIQCPQNFQYVWTGSTYIGIIKIPNVIPSTIKLYVEFSQRENIAWQNYYGKLTLFDDKETTFNKLYSGQPIVYRVDFPTPNVLPKLTLIAVNDKIICLDGGYPQPNTKLQLMHTLNSTYSLFSISPSPTRSQNPTFQQQRPFPATPQLTTPNVIEQRMPIRDGECGLENQVISPYIVGGEYLSPHQFPWLVALYKAERAGSNLIFVCDGTLISTRHVVSAAHCLPSNQPDATNIFVVHLGRHDRNDYLENYEVRYVWRYIIHPEFRSTAQPDADIALLYLEAPVGFSTSIRPACLWNESVNVDLLVGAKAAVAGWGKSEIRPEESRPKKTNVNILSSNDCQIALRSYLSIPTARTLCVRGAFSGGPCYGDSGGGLVVLRNGRWILRGIVSGGSSREQRCLVDYTFYCDLAQHRTWLLANII